MHALCLCPRSACTPIAHKLCAWLHAASPVHHQAAMLLLCAPRPARVHRPEGALALLEAVAQAHAARRHARRVLGVQQREPGGRVRQVQRLAPRPEDARNLGGVVRAQLAVLVLRLRAPGDAQPSGLRPSVRHSMPRMHVVSRAVRGLAPWSSGPPRAVRSWAPAAAIAATPAMVLLVRSSHSSVSAMLPVVAVVLVPCTNSPSQNCRVPPGQPLQPSFQGVAACQRLACEARQASQHRNPICTGACLCTCIPPGCPQTCRAGRCIRPGSPSWDRPLHRRSTWQTGSKQERRALGAD